MSFDYTNIKSLQFNTTNVNLTNGHYKAFIVNGYRYIIEINKQIISKIFDIKNRKYLNGKILTSSIERIENYIGKYKENIFTNEKYVFEVILSNRTITFVDILINNDNALQQETWETRLLNLNHLFKNQDFSENVIILDTTPTLQLDLTNSISVPTIIRNLFENVTYKTDHFLNPTLETFNLAVIGEGKIKKVNKHILKQTPYTKNSEILQPIKKFLCPNESDLLVLQERSPEDQLILINSLKENYFKNNKDEIKNDVIIFKYSQEHLYHLVAGMNKNNELCIFGIAKQTKEIINSNDKIISSEKPDIVNWENESLKDNFNENSVCYYKNFFIVNCRINNKFKSDINKLSTIVIMSISSNVDSTDFKKSVLKISSIPYQEKQKINPTILSNIETEELIKELILRFRIMFIDNSNCNEYIESLMNLLSTYSTSKPTYKIVSSQAISALKRQSENEKNDQSIKELKKCKPSKKTSSTYSTIYEEDSDSSTDIDIC